MIGSYLYRRTCRLASGHREKPAEPITEDVRDEGRAPAVPLGEPRYHANVLELGEKGSQLGWCERLGTGAFDLGDCVSQVREGPAPEKTEPSPSGEGNP